MMRQLKRMFRMTHKQVKRIPDLMGHMKHSCMIALIFMFLLTACNLPTQDQTPTETREAETSMDLVTPFSNNNSNLTQNTEDLHSGIP